MPENRVIYFSYAALTTIPLYLLYQLLMPAREASIPLAAGLLLLNGILAAIMRLLILKRASSLLGHRTLHRKILEVVGWNLLLAAGAGVSTALLWTGGDLARSLVLALVWVLTGLTLSLAIVMEILEKEIRLNETVIEHMDQERLLSDITVLKSELEPHFMFNSLTALSGLIDTDSRSALQFTSSLAHVYKYLLVNRERNFISLEDELELVEQYFYLLRIRFESSIALQIELNREQAAAFNIIPCSLQTLIENAVKHNSYTADRPLRILLRLRDNCIIVAHNYQPKPTLDTTRTGLKNLNLRYRILTNRRIRVEQGGGQFAVHVPILKKEANDQNSHS